MEAGCGMGGVLAGADRDTSQEKRAEQGWRDLPVMEPSNNREAEKKDVQRGEKSATPR
jgi:hypothetical protein